jgi:hypothetical protein
VFVGFVNVITNKLLFRILVKMSFTKPVSRSVRVRQFCFKVVEKIAVSFEVTIVMDVKGTKKK